MMVVESHLAGGRNFLDFQKHKDFSMGTEICEKQIAGGRFFWILKNVKTFEWGLQFLKEK